MTDKNIKENMVCITYKNGVKLSKSISNTTLKKIVWLLYSICYINDISQINIKIHNHNLNSKEVKNTINDNQQNQRKEDECITYPILNN